MENLEDRYLTTKQVATLLHVKERKVYELAAAGDIPGTRALGKWLFERDALDGWLRDHGPQDSARRETEIPSVFLGSHDPLLDWAVRDSQSGMATFFDGSQDGLQRFVQGEGIATGLHILDIETGAWNVPAVQSAAGNMPVVLMEWARRQRGLIVPQGNPDKLKGIADLAGKRVVPRQPGAGSQTLFEHLLRQHLVDPSQVSFCHPARTENDSAMAVAEGRAQAAFGLQSSARQFRLDFVPVTSERFDILVRRRAWFEPAFQRLLHFMRSDLLRERAAAMTGYDLSGAGTIHFNGM